MTREELLEELQVWRRRFDDDVVRIYKDGTAKRGDLAYEHWKFGLLDFLIEHLPSEVTGFQTLTESRGDKIGPGDEPFLHFQRSVGKKTVDYMDGLVSSVEKGYVDATPEKGTIIPAEIIEDAVSSRVRDPRKVFVVHGRNYDIRSSMFAFLRSIGLEPIEWSQAAKLTGKATPYTFEIIQAGFSVAQAAVIMFSPDDEARLRGEFVKRGDPAYEAALMPQARPNVIFEAGMAMAKFPDRTVIVEFGITRPMSDISGLNVIRMSNDPEVRNELADRLETAGCKVDTKNKRDWYKVGDFDLQTVDPVAPTKMKPNVLCVDTGVAKVADFGSGPFLVSPSESGSDIFLAFVATFSNEPTTDFPVSNLSSVTAQIFFLDSDSSEQIHRVHQAIWLDQNKPVRLDVGGQVHRLILAIRPNGELTTLERSGGSATSVYVLPERDSYVIRVRLISGNEWSQDYFFEMSGRAGGGSFKELRGGASS
ncbi:MAG: nucleotide-binding protein [Chloracidobacterium sp.]|nr:nucleotide-binding protein [Chloracidobacterium sp.]